MTERHLLSFKRGQQRGLQESKYTSKHLGASCSCCCCDKLFIGKFSVSLAIAYPQFRMLDTDRHLCGCDYICRACSRPPQRAQLCMHVLVLVHKTAAAAPNQRQSLLDEVLEPFNCLSVASVKSVRCGQLYPIRGSTATAIHGQQGRCGQRTAGVQHVVVPLEEAEVALRAPAHEVSPEVASERHSMLVQLHIDLHVKQSVICAHLYLYKLDGCLDPDMGPGNSLLRTERDVASTWGELVTQWLC